MACSRSPTGALGRRQELHGDTAGQQRGLRRGTLGQQHERGGTPDQQRGLHRGTLGTSGSSTGAPGQQQELHGGTWPAAAAAATRAAALRCYAHARACLETAQAASRRLLRYDRCEHYDSIARDAEAAERRGDGAKVWYHIKRLVGHTAKSLPGVQMADGSMARDAEQIKDRWHEYFMDHFGGTEVADVTHELPCQARAPRYGDWVPERADVQRVLARLPAGKACGPDGLSAEVWRAAGPEALDALHGIIADSFAYEYVPCQWRGGRLATRYKEKGAQTACPNSRGLLIADHAGKLVAHLIKEHTDGPYQRWIPDVQCGCTKGRATDMATHMVRSFIDVARRLDRSYMVSS